VSKVTIKDNQVNSQVTVIRLERQTVVK